MSESTSLADQSLRLARRLEYPKLRIDYYLRAFDQLAARAAARAGEPLPSESILALNHVLYEEEGFIGDADGTEDPRNCFLNEMLERREGAPSTLAMVYLETGRRMGLPLEGVDVPGEHWVKWPIDGKVMVIDPTSHGAVLSPSVILRRLEHRFGNLFTAASLLKFALKTLPDGQYAPRLLRELRQAYRHHQRWGKLLTVVDELLVHAPRDPELWKERSEIHHHLECPQAALRDYRRYLRLAPQRGESEQTRHQLARLEHAVDFLH